MNTAYPKISSMSPLFVVADLERSVDFYAQNLGFKIDFRYEDFYVGISRDGYSIHLKYCDPGIEEQANRLDNEHLDLCFSVEGIDGLFDAMKSLPVTIVQPLRQMPYGREFYI
ncbi:MAG: VOC family protein, partial [Mucilaginibacter sp.]